MNVVQMVNVLFVFVRAAGELASRKRKAAEGPMVQLYKNCVRATQAYGGRLQVCDSHPYDRSVTAVIKGNLARHAALM